MNTNQFRSLNKSEEKEFRQWARDNYQPGDEIKEIWHPVVQEECRLISEETPETFPVEYELSKNQKQFVRDARRQELDIRWDYSGRGMFGQKCPGVVVDHAGSFNTSAKTQQDGMGLSIIIYAQN